MTRLGETVRPGAASRFDLEEAFKFLGRGPTRRELALAADLLREAGVEVEYNEELIQLAEEFGSSGIVALDLTVALKHGVDALGRFR